MLQNRTLSRRSHPGEKKKTFFEGKKQVGFLICFSSIHIFPPTHTNILAVLCLTGATAESIIQPVSKTSHHISAEGGKKKRALYHLQTNLAAGTLLRECVGECSSEAYRQDSC